MGLNAKKVLSLAQSYTDLASLGLVNVTPDNTNHKIILEKTDGSKAELAFDPLRELSDVEPVEDTNKIKFVYSDGTKSEPIPIPTVKSIRRYKTTAEAEADIESIIADDIEQVIIEEEDPTIGGGDGGASSEELEEINAKLDSLANASFKIRSGAITTNLFDFNNNTSVGYKLRYDKNVHGYQKLEDTNYACTDKPIAIDKKYTQLKVNRAWVNILFYDNDGLFISNEQTTVAESIVNIPQNTKYIGIYGNVTVFNLVEVTYVTDGFQLWCAVGDSLTASDTLASQEEVENYVDYVSEALGIDVINKGVGSTGYMGANNFVDRVSTIPTNTTVLTVFGSFNDFSRIETKLGQLGDITTDTLYGAMNKFIEDVYTRCPDVLIGIITPTKWGYLSEWVDSSKADLCEKYVKALVDTANKWSIPVLDLYHESGLRPWKTEFCEKYYKDDNGNGKANSVHPLSNAHRKFIAPKVQNFIKYMVHDYK